MMICIINHIGPAQQERLIQDKYLIHFSSLWLYLPDIIW